MKISASHNAIFKMQARTLSILFVIALIALGANAQTATDGSTPLALSPGSPAGSYPLSDMDSVNLYNGSVNFGLPLLGIAGRGGAGYPITLHIDQKWRVERQFEPGVGYFYFSEPSWWSESVNGWHTFDAGRLDVRRGGSDDYSGNLYTKSLSRITFSAPDGTEYELRDVLTGGQPAIPSQYSSGFNRGRVFVTADGTSATYISDSDIIDVYYYGEDWTYFPTSGYLLLRDGTRFRVVDGKVEWMRDRNGNRVTFTYDIYKRVTSVTDSLNRQVTIIYSAGTTGYHEIKYKGFGGADRSVKVGVTNLGNALRSGYSLQSELQLFPEMDAPGGINHDPQVVSYVELPDLRRFQFQYNSYHELARIVLPTGGAIEYDYAAGLTNGYASGVFNASPYKYIYRRVIERRIYPDGGSGAGYESRMTYSRPETTTTNDGYVITDQYNASGLLLGRSKHYFYGSPRLSFSQKQTDYPAWEDGREYKTEVFDPNGPGTSVLRLMTNTFAQRAPVSWWTGTPETEPPNDTRLIETTTAIEPSGANLVSKQTFGYDQYNNQTDVHQYGFETGTSGALVRRSHTDYLTTNSVNGVAYDTLNPNPTNPSLTATFHIRNLAAHTFVYDSVGTEKAQTSFEYDNYTADQGNLHAALVPRSLISGLCDATTQNCPNGPNFADQNFKQRGNATMVTNWRLPSTEVKSYSQYDVAGNVIKTIDPMGNEVNVDFSDHFGTPNAEAQQNSGAVELGSQVSYAFPWKVSNQLGHNVFMQVDFYIGKAVDAEDANGITYSAHYNDLLDRPTQLIKASNQGSAVKSQTSFGYDDNNRIITSTSDQSVFNDPYPLKSQFVYDQMGRTIEKRQYETAGGYIAVKTEYDALGRAYRTSNPFRAGESVLWTTSAFDALGRVTSVTTPDSAAVTTSYSGNTVTVSDQNGKSRKSVTDALGRLFQVYEDPNGLNYLTSYNYDVLDSLTTVSQGVQTRTFVYDSLKRLTSATNPESGTISYIYDAAGNLTQKTDARSIVTTYAYDALNRNITVTYSNDPAGTSTVNRYYDGFKDGTNNNIPNSKGRLWQTETSGPAGSRTTIKSFDPLGRPLTQEQQFYSNNAWSGSYTVQRVYNLAGQVLTQTYPSGHTVNYAYDQAGRTSSFTGNLGEGVTRNYASEFQYTERGALQQERFGTDTLLYHKQRYNQRGQMWDMRLSTVPFATDPANDDRGSLVNYYSNNFVQGGAGADNNGNLLRQEIFIPGNGFFQDNFTYDSLNRLKSISEKLNGAGTDSFKQAYTFDRWGNRTIDQNNTTANVPHPQYTVDPTNNNRLLAPAGYTHEYDDAGNQTRDTYTTNSPTGGYRTYDAENRIIGSQRALVGAERLGWAYYTYDGNGQRVRRKPFGYEIWQVYGFDGELVAEYPQNGPSVAVAQPQKEYGYRNGQLLVTTEPWVNAAWNKPATQTDNLDATTTAAKAVNGDADGTLADGSVAATNSHANSWWQVDLQSVQPISSITVWGRTDCCPEMTSDFYVFVSDVPFTSYDLNTTLSQPGVSNHHYLDYADPASIEFNRTGRYVRVQLVGTQSLALAEVQVWSAAAKVNWLVTDHLGTPRMIVDETGSLAGVSRHDYLPFGEEIFAGTGGRTTAQGYDVADGVRQKFTQKERDNETGLDYFLARYYLSTQGRFTSPDEFTGGPDELYYFVDDAAANPTFYADLRKPQSLNKYQYAFNNPLRYVDPDGHDADGVDPDPQDPKQCPCVTPAHVEQLGNDISRGLDKVEDGVRKVGTVAIVQVLVAVIETIVGPLRPVPVPNTAQPTTAQPTTGSPPSQQSQPLPPPAPIQRKDSVRTATRSPGGVTPGNTVTDKQAAARLKSGGDTVSPSRAKAKEVAKKAAPDGRVVHDRPHRPGYRPHYHDKKRKNGHSFYD